MTARCTAVHKSMSTRCERPDEGEAHKDMGHKADFEGADYYWKPTVDEWARWRRMAQTVRWPEYDSDPTRRLDKQDFFTTVMKSKATKVVVATGSPQTPWANIMALNDVTLPDGTRALVLEL